VFRVLSILGSHGVTFSFLLFKTFGGNSQFLGGIELSLLLQVQSLLVVGQLSFSILSGSGEGFSLGGDLDDQGFEVQLGLGLSLPGVDEGLLELLSNFSELVDDVLELFGREGGGDLHEGEDGVALSDLVQLGEGGEDLGVGLDGAELADDDIDGINDLGGFVVEFLEVLGVFLSLLGEFGFLFVEDVELDSLVLDFDFEFFNLGGQGGDFGGGLLDFVGSEVNSSVVLEDLGFAVNFVSSVLLVSLLLVQHEVFSELLEHLGDVREGGLVVQLEGDGVKQFSSELVVFHGLELGEENLIGVRVSLDEDGLS
jgi:hypothetical protein